MRSTTLQVHVGMPTCAQPAAAHIHISNDSIDLRHNFCVACIVGSEHSLINDQSLTHLYKIHHLFMTLDFHNFNMQFRYNLWHLNCSKAQ